MSDATHPLDDGPPPDALPPRPGQALPEGRNFGVRDAMIVIAVVAVLARLAIEAGAVVALVVLGVLAISGAAGAVALAVRGLAARSEPMLWVVANAVERGLPLGPGVEACGDVCGGGVRLRSLAVARLLEKGATPGEAFARVPDSFPREGIVFLRMGWDGPRLGDALRGLARRRAEWKPFRGAMAMRLVYFAWTLLAMQAVLALFLMRIAPQIEMIAADFGVPLPAITRWTITAGVTVMQWPVVLTVVVLDLLAVPLLMAAFLDPMEWKLAPVDWLLLRRHGATVLRALSGEVAMGRPMPEALERVAGSYRRGVVRRRVAKARLRVDRGWPWSRSLASVGLIRRADAAVLDAASRAGNLAWALGDLADGLDRRAGVRLVALGQAFFPVMVLAVAVPVLVLAVAYFLPLVTLTQALAP